MKFVADVLENEYKDWKQGDVILISTPTGSGKTTFILQKLIPMFALKNQKILYLVNRKILKKQLEAEISKLSYNLIDSIDVMTYQEIEYEARHLSYEQYSFKYVSNDPNGEIPIYACVVCDECHYFLMDSNYNTNTIFSYNLVYGFSPNRLTIFMSATINEIEERITKDFRRTTAYKSMWFKFPREGENFPYEKEPGNKKVYSIKAEYDYLDIHCIYNDSEIPKLVIENDEKWLIFVDSVALGERLHNKISKYMESNRKMKNKSGSEVVFITADYAANPESANEVNVIVRSNKQSAKVLITTSVLDNGVNIKDDELRNLIIIADTKTEFIQMLGRKRDDGEKVQLYLYSQSKTHFDRRIRANDRKRHLAGETYYWIRDNWYRFINNIDDRKSVQENRLIQQGHCWLVQNMIDNKINMEDMKSIYTEYMGCFKLNPFSFYNLENLNRFYNRIIERFLKEGENAFLYEQLEWLGKKEDEIHTIIRKSKEERISRSKRVLEQVFKENLDKPMDERKSKKFKKEIKDVLRILYSEIKDDEQRRVRENALLKGDRPINKADLKVLHEEFGIEYKMDVNDGIYTIRRL